MANTNQTSGKQATSVKPAPAPTPAPAPATTGKKKGRAPVDPNETRRGRFIRLGGARVAKALTAIRVIGNLSGSSYQYTQADIDKIDKALTNAVKESIAKFSPNTGEAKAQASFSFEG